MNAVEASMMSWRGKKGERTPETQNFLYREHFYTKITVHDGWRILLTDQGWWWLFLLLHLARLLERNDSAFLQSHVQFHLFYRLQKAVCTRSQLWWTGGNRSRPWKINQRQSVLETQTLIFIFSPVRGNFPSPPYHLPSSSYIQTVLSIHLKVHNIGIVGTWWVRNS